MPFIPLPVFTNNSSTTIAVNGYQGGAATAGAPAQGTAETWTVSSSASFPAVEIGATQFHIADPQAPSEVITVQNISGTTWTVIRGASGADATTPVTHAAGATFVQTITAGELAGMQYPAWQFPVQQYNAQGDGKIGTNGTGASGQAVLTDAGASFVNATAPAGDVGKVIIVNQGAGSATSPTNPFCGTIISVNSATSVTLSANLAATCTNAPYIYGTDDSAAITAAVTAAAQWAVATGNYKAQVVFEPQNYMLGALTQSTTKQWPPYNTGANYTYNTHIPLPFATQYDRKLAIDLIGVGSSAEPDFWGSAVPCLQGTCLVSAVFPPSQPDATYGQMSVIGVPASNANIGNGGISGGAFGNVLVTISGITVVTPYNGQQFGIDLRVAAQANIDDGAAVAFAPVNFNAQACGGTWLRRTSLPSNTVAVGLAMPTTGNNDNNNIGRFAAEGLAIGLQICEHLTAQRVATVYCGTGIRIDPVMTGAVVHGASIEFWSCEGGTTGLGCTVPGQYPLFIGNADFEAMLTWYVDDANNTLTGIMYWQDIFQSSPGTGAIGVNGAQAYNIINNRMYPGPWVVNAGLSIPAAPAAPATTVAQQNTAFRPATIYAKATTGITVVTVGPASTGMTTTGLVAASTVTVPIRVPSGHWYAVTYTGTLTTTWVLE